MASNKNMAATPPPEVDDNTPILNDKDVRFLMALLHNMNGRPDVKWDQVANTMGLKDEKQSKEKFRVLSVKFHWNGDGGKTLVPQPAGAEAAEISDTETKFIKALFDNLTTKPDADWEKVAHEYGEVKNVKQAKEKYRVMAWKYSWARKAVDDVANKRPKTTSAPAAKATTAKTATGGKATRATSAKGTDDLKPNTSTTKSTTAGNKRAAPTEDNDETSQAAPPAKRTRVKQAASSNAVIDAEEPLFPGLTNKATTAQITTTKAATNGADGDVEDAEAVPTASKSSLPTKSKAASTKAAATKLAKDTAVKTTKATKTATAPAPKAESTTKETGDDAKAEIPAKPARKSRAKAKVAPPVTKRTTRSTSTEEAKRAESAAVAEVKPQTAEEAKATLMEEIVQVATKAVENLAKYKASKDTDSESA